MSCTSEMDVDYLEPEETGLTYVEIVTPIEGIGEYRGCTSQGLSISDKYAFITYDTGLIQVLDYSSKKIVSSFEMPDGVHHKKNHAGMAVFGDVYYDETDSFPLLYISSYKESKCYVLRVSLSGAELVQEIQMDQSWHFFVDNKDLIVRLNDNTYYVFDLPEVSQQYVYLDKSNAKQSFSFDIPNMHYAGAFCENGRMFVLCYYKETPNGVVGKYDRLVEFDYHNNAFISEIVFRDLRIRTIEFEGLSVTPMGDIVISFVTDQLATIHFCDNTNAYESFQNHTS